MTKIHLFFQLTFFDKKQPNAYKAYTAWDYDSQEESMHACIFCWPGVRPGVRYVFSENMTTCIDTAAGAPVCLIIILERAGGIEARINGKLRLDHLPVRKSVSQMWSANITSLQQCGVCSLTNSGLF